MFFIVRGSLFRALSSTTGFFFFSVATRSLEVGGDVVVPRLLCLIPLVASGSHLRNYPISSTWLTTFVLWIATVSKAFNQLLTDAFLLPVNSAMRHLINISWHSTKFSHALPQLLMFPWTTSNQSNCSAKLSPSNNSCRVVRYEGTEEKSRDKVQRIAEYCVTLSLRATLFSYFVVVRRRLIRTKICLLEK